MLSIGARPTPGVQFLEVPVKLDAVTIQLYRNFVDPQRIAIESDVTCLVGKNESGKTTILQALHRLKPANGEETSFDLTVEYPRWRLARDRRKNPDLGKTAPIAAEFALDDADRAALEEVYGAPIPDAAICCATRTYVNMPTVSLTAKLDAAIATAAQTAKLAYDDIANLPDSGTTAELATVAKAIAKEHREAGDGPRAKTLTAFAAEIEKYTVLVGEEGSTEEQREALWERVPSFFYFSNYDTLPGETNLTVLAKKIASGGALDAKERTVVSLLAHAGEAPSDFLDDDYDSRKAELQSASIDLSRHVFQYWKQNPDLTVVFDTDNRVIATHPNGNEVANRFLKIELRDGRHGDVETNFDTRSTGFQWFFSFFAAFSEYQESNDVTPPGHWTPPPGRCRQAGGASSIQQIGQRGADKVAGRRSKEWLVFAVGLLQLPRREHDDVTSVARPAHDLIVQLPDLLLPDLDGRRVEVRAHDQEVDVGVRVRLAAGHGPEQLDRGGCVLPVGNQLSETLVQEKPRGEDPLDAGPEQMLAVGLVRISLAEPVLDHDPLLDEPRQRLAHASLAGILDHRGDLTSGKRDLHVGQRSQNRPLQGRGDDLVRRREVHLHSVLKYAYAHNSTERSGAEQRQRHHGDPVRPAVRALPGRDNDEVDHVIRELLTQPQQMADVGVIRSGGQLDLDANHLTFRAFHHQVHFPLTSGSPKVPDPCHSRRGRDSNAQRRQRFEQRASHESATRAAQRSGGQVEQPGGQGRIGELVLRRGLQAPQWVATVAPARHGIEHPDAGEEVPIGDGRGLGRL